MKQWDTVAIVGVGLIGGSIGLALRRRKLARRVIGIGRRAGSLRAALRMGAVTSTTLHLARGVAEAELIVVATPVGRIVEHVQAVAEHCPAGALVTDAGSTKAEIVHALRGRLPRDVRFIGSHPLAGSDKSGPAAADAALFEGKLVIITPTPDDDAEACRRISRFWTALGARVKTMTPEDHDQAVAATSHLPHLMASAIAAATPDEFLPLAASGWMDTTRVAAADPDLWTQIFRSNKANVLSALDSTEKTLAALRKALESENGDGLEEILAAAKRNRDSVK